MGRGNRATYCQTRHCASGNPAEPAPSPSNRVTALSFLWAWGKATPLDMNTTTTTRTTYARLGADDEIHGAPLPAVQLADATATPAPTPATDPCVINPEAVSGDPFSHTFKKIFSQASGSSSPCGSDAKTAMGIIAAIIVLYIVLFIGKLFWCCCHKAKGGTLSYGCP